MYSVKLCWKEVRRSIVENIRTSENVRNSGFYCRGRIVAVFFLFVLPPIGFAVCVFSPFFDAFMQSKMSVFDAWWVAVVAIGCVSLVQPNRNISTRLIVLLAILLSAATLILMCQYSGQHEPGLRLANYLGPIVAAGVMSHLLPEQQRPFQTMALASAIGILLTFCHSVLIHMGLLALPFGLVDTSHLRSSFGQQNLLAAFVSFQMPFVLFGWADSRGKARLGYGVAILIGMIVILASGCRSALLSCFACIGIFAVARRSRSQIMWGSVVVVGSLLLMGFALALWQPELICTKWTNVGHRWEVWQASLRMLQSHPLGVGPGRFGDTNGAFLEMPRVGDYRRFDHPHNEWLCLTVEHGLIVALLVFGLLTFLLYKCYTARPQKLGAEHHLAMAILATVAIEGSCSFPFDTGPGRWLLVVGLALILKQLSSGHRPSRIRWQHQTAAICIFGFCWFQVSESYRAVITAGTAHSLSQLEHACHQHPAQHRICERAADLAIWEGDTDAAQRIIARLSSRGRNVVSETARFAELKLHIRNGRTAQARQLWRALSVRQQSMTERFFSEWAL